MPAKPAPNAVKKRARSEDDVHGFLADLEHTMKPLILAVRKTIIEADRSISEGIKWKAPSFRTSEYFATINLRAKQGVELILHFGAKKNRISETGVAIPDPNSLLTWLGKDRAKITFRDTKDFADKRAAFTALIRAWIKHVE